ncbi:MAG: hypothetical protein ACEPOW_13805 [Bacteroidales bacterium]
MKRTINLMDVEIFDIKNVKYDKDQMKETCIQLANFVFAKASNWEMLEVARDINELKPVKINEDMKDRIIESISGQGGFLFFVLAPIKKYLKEEFEKPLPKEKK